MIWSRKRPVGREIRQLRQVVHRVEADIQAILKDTDENWGLIIKAIHEGDARGHEFKAATVRGIVEDLWEDYKKIIDKRGEGVTRELKLILDGLDNGKIDSYKQLALRLAHARSKGERWINRITDELNGLAGLERQFTD